jgi:hypothetical protein
MSAHPLVVLVCVSDELASATPAPERQAAVLESFRTHGAAIIVDAVELRPLRCAARSDGR